MAIENRKQKRAFLRREVMINGTIRVLGLNLSVGGIYVHTSRHFAPDSVVDLTLPLNTDCLNVRARIQHSRDGVGMGLRFENITEEQLASIRTFLDEAGECSVVGDKKAMTMHENASARL